MFSRGSLAQAQFTWYQQRFELNGQQNIPLLGGKSPFSFK